MLWVGVQISALFFKEIFGSISQQKKKMHIPITLAAPLLEIYLLDKFAKICKFMCTRMFIEGLLLQSAEKKN